MPSICVNKQLRMHMHSSHCSYLYVETWECIITNRQHYQILKMDAFYVFRVTAVLTTK